MDEFTGKVVLITGAGGGLGREVALAFSTLGATIAAQDINPINLNETVNLIQHAGGKASSYIFDIAKCMPIEAMVTQIVDHHGRIDFLINHASVAPDEYLLEMDEWEYHRTLDVNLGGPFFTMQKVGRVMQQRGGGAIVNLVFAYPGREIQKGQAAFLASQAGLIGLTGAASRELAGYNIRVNSVCASSSELNLCLPQAWDVTVYRRWLEMLPEEMRGKYSHLASLVLFLCSNAASLMTGLVVAPEPG